MGEAKPTPGPWIAVGTGGPWEQRLNIRAAHWGCVASVGVDPSMPHWDGPQRANARLIEEAGTVFHETQCTPRQLVERVKELEVVLQAAVDCGMVPKSSAADGGASKYSTQVLVADRIRAALSKARPNTAAVAGPLASDDEMFEFWWADRMPEATQSEAWAEWCALRSDKQEPSP